MAGHDHHHSHSHDSTKNIKVAFFLNFSFTILEIIGGLLTNSLAILSDALHDLGDTFSLGLSWYLDKVSKKKRTEIFSYGYKRFSLLAALINSVILLAGSIFLLSESIPRIFNPEVSNAKGMILISIIGILFNGAAVLKVRKGSSMNEKVVSWHLLEDVLGWVVVLVGSIGMLIFNLPIIDPILSVLVTLYVLWNVHKNLLQSAKIFLQGVPDGMNIKQIEEKILEVEGVESVHDTHIWSNDGENNVLTVHLVIRSKRTEKQIVKIKEEVKHLLEHEGIQHSTLEVEYSNESCEIECIE